MRRTVHIQLVCLVLAALLAASEKCYQAEWGFQQHGTPINPVTVHQHNGSAIWSNEGFYRYSGSTPQTGFEEDEAHVVIITRDQFDTDGLIFVIDYTSNSGGGSMSLSAKLYECAGPACDATDSSLYAQSGFTVCLEVFVF